MINSYLRNSMTNSIPIVENSQNFANIITRLQPKTYLLRYLIIINLIFGAWYLQWRITNSVNFNALWLSIPLLLAEIYSYLGGVMFFVGLWRPIERKIRSFNQLIPSFPLSEYPTIDVFITCYNEPVEMVAATAKAALNLNYPVNKLKVYILDDGNSSAMRMIAETLCLEDLQSAELQKEAEKINQQRAKLAQQLKQLKQIIPEIENAEKFLAHYQIEVESNHKSFCQVLAWFETLKTEDIPHTVWIMCQTALGEAFGNVVDHAHRHLPDDTPIKIEVAIYSQLIQIKIWDRGNGFDLEEHLQLLPELENIDLNAERGRGFGILQQVTDYVSYQRLENNTNCLLIFKSYNNQNFTNSQLEKKYLAGYLQSFRNLTLLLNNKIPDISSYINAEIKKLEQAIYEQELALSDLSRCRYIARPKPQGKPHHAKAGNINYAIFSGETSGDFILTLDADHIPKPQLLQRVLTYFYQYNINTGKYEPNQIAFVQTPQSFSNIPKGDPFGHQARLFYGPIQQGKDGMNSAFYTGTNAVLRREALLSVGLQNFATQYELDTEKLDEVNLIGGLSSASITEDMNTAMRLHNAGWKSAYHHEELSSGLAPDDLSSTLKQRLRWAQGTIQVLQQENPLKKSGLSFWQKLQYFQTMYSYFAGFATLIFILCPIIYFFTGTIPVNAIGADFAIHFIPAFILNRLTFLVVSWGISASELWRAEQYAIALFPLFIQAVITVFTGKQLKFQVTPKQRQSGIYFGLVIPQLIIFLLTILGIIWCLYQFFTGNLNNAWLYVVNSCWAIYNLALLWVIIKAAIWQPKY